MSLHNNNNQLWKVRFDAWLISTNCILLIVPVMKQLSSEEWGIAIGPWSIKDVSCVGNPLLWAFIVVCLTLTNWSSLETCLRAFWWINVQEDLKKVDRNQSDVSKCRTYIKHMYGLIFFHQFAMQINSALMKYL
jgi:hypothetical protein